jgi:hypothetical protein
MVEQEYSEQAYQNMPYPQSSQYPYPENKADLLDKIRPEEVVECIKQRLMGKEFDVTKDAWVSNPALKDVSMTEIGSVAITNLIFPASTRNVSISNLDDEEIKKRLLSIIKTAMKMCLDNWEDYGIKSTAQLFFIKEVVYTNTLVALKQPQNEGIRRMLNSTISENRSVSTYGEEKRGGILGLIRKR